MDLRRLTALLRSWLPITVVAVACDARRGSVSRRDVAPGSPPRAIVTGGAGFIGSHLVDRLVAEGVDVLVVDDLSTGDARVLPPDVRLERLDIAVADLDSLFGAWRPAVVYHLAAQASVTASVRDPLRDLAVNVVGSHRVAVAAREAGADPARLRLLGRRRLWRDPAAGDGDHPRGTHLLLRGPQARRRGSRDAGRPALRHRPAVERLRASPARRTRGGGRRGLRRPGGHQGLPDDPWRRHADDGTSSTSSTSLTPCGCLADRTRQWAPGTSPPVRAPRSTHSPTRSSGRSGRRFDATTAPAGQATSSIRRSPRAASSRPAGARGSPWPRRSPTWSKPPVARLRARLMADADRSMDADPSTGVSGGVRRQRWPPELPDAFLANRPVDGCGATRIRTCSPGSSDHAVVNVLAIAWLALGLVWAIGFGSWAAWVAGERSRRRPPWFLFGAILGPGALAILNAAPPGVCARCLSPVVGWSTTCAFCGEDVRANPMVEVMLGSEQPQPRPARAPMAATSPAASRRPRSRRGPDAARPRPRHGRGPRRGPGARRRPGPRRGPGSRRGPGPRCGPGARGGRGPAVRGSPRTRRRKPAARTAAGTARPPSEPARPPNP